MPKGRYISYLRVSSQRQGESGLGLEAQRQAVANYMQGTEWQLLREFVEVESGKRNDRPALEEALRYCRIHNATLIVGKLDRLARNARFLLKLVEETGTRGVVFCDLPHIPEGHNGKFIITNMAAVAELEGAAISARTRAALAAAKAIGASLGGRRVSADRWASISAEGRKAGTSKRSQTSLNWAKDVLPVIEDIRSARGDSLRVIAAELNSRGIETRRGGKWTPVQVQRVISRAEHGSR